MKEILEALGVLAGTCIYLTIFISFRNYWPYNVR